MIQNLLTPTAIQLLLREPFYAHLLTSLSREVSETTTSTLGLLRRDDHFVLAVNPRFWEEELTDPDHRYGALKHELLHLVFRHLLRAREFADPFLYNVAADLVVNQYIETDYLLPGASRLADFPELTLPAGEPTRYYYDRLRPIWEGPSSPAKATLQELYERREQLFAGHAAWFKPCSPLESVLLTRQLSTALRRARQKNAGNLPAGLRRALAWADRPERARIDWRRVLRLFVSNSSRTRLKNTIRRPSKRYGTTPGIALQRQHRLLVAVDVSGSIADADLQDFFNELYQLWRRGIEVRLLTFDNRVRSVTAYRGYPPGDLPGGGGTDFEPVLAYAHEQKGWDGLILLTDGRAPMPVTPCRLPLLWVVSRAGIGRDSLLFGALPGRAVKMNA